MATVPSNVLSNRTLIECAVISSIASKTSFYFRESPMECIMEEEDRVFLSDPFESEVIRFVTARKGMDECTYTIMLFLETGLRYFDNNVKLA